MRYAIIQSGGKQYKAVEGQTVEVDKLTLEIGKKVELNDVLLIADGENVLVGTPTVAEAKVAATVVAQDKGPKIIVFKYKPKKRIRVKTGHRQDFTRLQIDSINAKGLAKSAEVKQAAPEAEAVAEKPKAAARPRKAKATVTAKKPAAAKAAPAKKKAATKAKPKKR